MKVDNFLAGYNHSLNSLKAQNIEARNNAARAKEDGAEFDKALKEQTDAFESFLIKTVLDISLKDKVSLFEKDASDDIYNSMYNDTMSKALSGGIGFSQLLFDFLKERG